MPDGGDVMTDRGNLLQNVVELTWGKSRHGSRERFHQQMVRMKTNAKCTADQKN